MIIICFVLEELKYLTTLKEPRDVGGRGVSCLTIVDCRLYVIYGNHSYHTNVLVFDCKAPFKKVDEIGIRELEAPKGIVGCSTTSQLFILDAYYDAEFYSVWRVDLNNRDNIDQMIDFDSTVIMEMSLFENRLLIQTVESVLVYDIHSREVLKTVRLHKNLQGEQSLSRVIESNRGSFFVVRESSSDHNTVSEKDSAGRVIRVFDKQIVGHYMALDSDDGLLVGPFNVRNKRLSFLQLDENLNLKNTLITRRLQSNLRALFYDKNSKVLAVSLDNGEVKIFKREGKGMTRTPLREDDKLDADRVLP